MKRQFSTEAVRALIETGKIKSFPDIFNQYGFAPTPLAKALGMNTGRLDLLTKTPERLTDIDKLLIAQYFQLPAKIIFDLFEKSALQREGEILEEYYAQRGAKRRAKALRGSNR